MSRDVTQLVMDRYFIDELKKKIEHLNNELQERLKTLQKRCSHPTTKTDRKYYSGGYDYVSSISITTTCTLCDKILESYDDPNHVGRHG